eukprot:CAMPEP_0184350944 /NCGR_PEP_ID=MMETSP1089-20130417/43272_1 /TAXON_ID=38269 ORGANISM="Gloeochaete wittrockiana, Strain SAG46.84" /NCGR_SAMPLE_ID=MMETSP1089 /ASSEMBLY_ACC=CAM_ASM_000445 /LENGTH=140 /DNA_ID=CAMNT_0026684083 /DNA_START=17 /DNA_END=439 /DNA_ORIENTATION=-
MKTAFVLALLCLLALVSFTEARRQTVKSVPAANQGIPAEYAEDLKRMEQYLKLVKSENSEVLSAKLENQLFIHSQQIQEPVEEKKRAIVFPELEPIVQKSARSGQNERAEALRNQIISQRPKNTRNTFESLAEVVQSRQF